MTASDFTETTFDSDWEETIMETIMTGQPGRVIIVGAGPAGMALAYLLARRGVGVTVLETHHDFARAFRGEGVQRSGIDAFRQMGLGEQFDRLPHIAMQFIEMYSGGRRVVRADLEGFGRGGIRLVSQPALLQMLADEAGRHPSFRLERGVAMRDFLREHGRVVGALSPPRRLHRNAEKDRNRDGAIPPRTSPAARRRVPVGVAP